MDELLTGLSLITAIPLFGFLILISFMVGAYTLNKLGIYKNLENPNIQHYIIPTIVGFIILFLIIEVYTSIFPYKGEPYIRK